LIAPRVVITAGHCVYLHGAGGWASSIEVSAGRNGTSYPFGTVRSSTLRAIAQWTRDQNRNYDYGCIVLPSVPRGASGLPFCFNFAARSNAELSGGALNLSGYPGDKGGTTQWFHARKAKSVAAFTITYDIDTAGGQSGSPVWQYSGGTRTAVGVHTNGSPIGNSATRITPAVAAMLGSWKALGS
jgi:V8-like Glu-specific endopeptidase